MLEKNFPCKIEEIVSFFAQNLGLDKSVLSTEFLPDRPLQISNKQKCLLYFQEISL